MKVNQTTLTIAEYCAQIKANDLYPNNDYQRSNKVWPSAAKSYLIDTILEGYPMPKVSLYQKTDLRTRKTVKEIVDGQQRTQAIIDFYNDKLRVTGKSQYSGKKYSTLPEDIQQRFLDYALPVDLFVGATEAEIRQVFRRMNSYTVPLNENERRHAIFQGDFKWFIVDMTGLYSQSLKDMGVFSEKQISRMTDAQFFAEICLALLDGVETYSKTRLEQLYKKFDAEESFTAEDKIRSIIEKSIRQLLEWKSLHKTVLMKPAIAYSLVIAIAHVSEDWNADFDRIVPLQRPSAISVNAEANLGALAEAMESDGEKSAEVEKFIKASEAGTNTKNNREIRFSLLCEMLSK